MKTTHAIGSSKGRDWQMYRTTLNGATKSPTVAPPLTRARQMSPGFVSQMHSSPAILVQNPLSAVRYDDVGKPGAHCALLLACAVQRRRFSPWVKVPPGNRSSRKQPEQLWRRRDG